MKIARCYNLLVNVLIDCSTNSSLILVSVDLILPRAHVRMWWVLWQSQASHWTTCQVCSYALRSYPDLSRRITTLLGALFREVSSLQWWGHNENAFRPLPLTDSCLQARNWTSWNIICTFDPSHIKLIHITGKVGALTYASMPNNTYQWLSLATLMSSSITSLQVLVKLVSCSYSQVLSKDCDSPQSSP